MKMEIELTDEQAEKVEILKENGIEVGEAIEILFDSSRPTPGPISRVTSACPICALWW